MLRQALRFTAGTATLAAGGWVVRAAHGAPAALGAGPAQIARVVARAGGSVNYEEGAFTNAEPASAISLTREEQWKLAHQMFRGSTEQRPPAAVPLVTPATGERAGELAVTWYGHSSAVIEIDGYRVLADPVWSERCSPSRTVGPQRLHPVPAPLGALPAVDAIVISHDHYDHLDIETVAALAGTQRAVFFVPLGVGAHLRQWGIPDERIVELDWGGSGRVGELTVTCTPARHFSGRFLTRNTTLWSSWSLAGPRHRAFFGGDTGYTRSFAEIGAEHGPFDLTLMPVGAYHHGWPDIHMTPEEAVRAHRDVTDPGAGLFVPIHWGTFRLAPHPWSEPVERMLSAAAEAGIGAAVPRPGQRVEPPAPGTLADPALDPWWRG